MLVNSYGRDTSWEPIPLSERYTALDLLRGLALFGVLMINLLNFFRVSLYDHILRSNVATDRISQAIDTLAAGALEFKAFGLFSLTFGIGVAVQAERARKRGIKVVPFLVRRFLVLLGFGLVHMLLISNVDILTLYAVCGLALVALLRLPSAVLVILGLAAVSLPVITAALALPPEDVLRAHGAEATRIYSQGSWAEILFLRWRETKELIAPLLLFVMQRTLGLMMIGVAVWRYGIVRNPQRFRTPLLALCAGAGLIGAANTTAHLISKSSGYPSVEMPWVIRAAGSDIPLVFAYAAALLVWQRSERALRWTAPLAAAGRMALSNYLAQSIIFGFLFYGYGLGLFGRLASASAAAIGIAVYAGQLWFSVWWLRRYRFGPFEWVWRSLTYGQRQPLLAKSAGDQR